MLSDEEILNIKLAISQKQKEIFDLQNQLKGDMMENSIRGINEQIERVRNGDTGQGTRANI